MNKWPLAGAGLMLAGINYAAWRLCSYEPSITRYRLQDTHWQGDRPLRLALVSDFHSGSGQWSGKALARIVLNEQADALLIAGDHFDRKGEIDEGLALITEVVPHIPVFFVTGNHEEGRSDRVEMVEELRACGVAVLDNEGAAFQAAGQRIEVLGFKDVAAFADRDDWVWAAGSPLKEGPVDRQAYRVVLSHRPEQVDFYNQLQAHLVLCGHAHGGQWRLPVIGGVFAPGQGLFPRFSRGIYTCGKKHPYHLIVSAGFAVHPLVPRIANRPELVMVDIG